MPTQDAIDQQLRRLATHRATLAHYLDQVSALGSAHTPPGVGAGIREARAGIARCKAALGGWGVAVEDHPDDEAGGPPAAPAGAAEVERSLRAALPADDQRQAPGLARLLSSLAEGEITLEELGARLAADPTLAPLLRGLVGQQVGSGASAVSFGAGSQVGDIRIGNVAGRDSITVNVYHGEPVAGAAPAAPAPEGEEGRPLRVFLCHSSADKAAVRRLSQLLADGGAAPWLDEEQLIPGQDWRRAIPTAVEASDVVLVCLSREAVGREGYLRDEIAFALTVAERRPEGSIFLIPLLLEPCAVSERLARWHWVSLAEPQGMGRLLRALRARAAEVGAAEPDLPAEAWPVPGAATQDAPSSSPGPDPAAPPPPALNPRDQRLVAARGLAAQGRWAEAAARYEELAAQGALPERDAASLERARSERWLPRAEEQAEAAEAGWEWAAAAALWAEIAARHPAHADAVARLERARAEQALDEQAQDAADLIDQAEWEAALAMIGEIMGRRPGYAHPAIDLGALGRRAQAALAYELAVELAERRDWAGAIAALTAAPAAALGDDGRALLAHARDAQRADERRREQEKARQRAERKRASPEGAADMVRVGRYDEALERLTEAVVNPATSDAAALLAARLAETAAAPLTARIQAAQLAGRLGDPRAPAGADDWRRELGRRGESFGPQAWGDLPPPYWCYVPAGSYRIGGWEPKQAGAEISLPAFWIARLPITVAQYAPYVAAGGEVPYGWNQAPYDAPNQPVIGVNWMSTTSYCAWLTEWLGGALPAGHVVRLATEAEWEAAAAYDGAAQRRPYPWGDDRPTLERAIYDATKLKQPAPAGCCPAGAATCGALDMAGNVWELTASDYRSYPAGSHTLQKDVTDGWTAWRGGSWSQNSSYVRCGARDGYYLGIDAVGHVGFRVVLAPLLARMS